MPVTTKSSQIHSFYKKSRSDRLSTLKTFASLTNKEIALLESMNALDFNTADRMSENVISTIQTPLGIATNFIINEQEFVVPMATEEPSIIAAASYAAQLSRSAGGFFASCTDSIMIGQIQVTNISNSLQAQTEIIKNKQKLLNTANAKDPILIKHGGGAQDIQVKIITTNRGEMLIAHILVDVKDAMGANIVNTMCEAISPEISRLTGGKILLRIISNLSIHRIVKSHATWSKKEIGEEVIENILDAQAFAQADVFRTSTHNKGIMNGIDAVALATGNDFRAIEAGAHCFALLNNTNNTYKPLTKYNKNSTGDLVGEIELPLAVGTIGGSITSNPMAQISLNILKNPTANKLACIMASVGLAQNFAALRALVCEGIQKGHMKLHNKKIAISNESCK